MGVLFKKYRRGIIFLAVVFFAVPFPTTTVPVWGVRFVDVKGNPISSLPVEQIWQNFSIESQENITEGQTDSEGYLIFPERRIWSPFIMRVVHPIGNFLSAGVHASYDSSSYLIPMCYSLRNRGNDAIYPGSKIPTKIVLEYVKSPSEKIWPDALKPADQFVRIEEQVKNAQQPS